MKGVRKILGLSVFGLVACLTFWGLAAYSVSEKAPVKWLDYSKAFLQSANIGLDIAAISIIIHWLG